MATTHSTWEYYKNEYRGPLPEENYRHWASAANAHIRLCTGGKNEGAGQAMQENLQRCECELADAFYGFSLVPRGVVSVNNDGYAATFGSRFAGGSTESEAVVLEKICRRYLALPENLLYRGGSYVPLF